MSVFSINSLKFVKAFPKFLRGKIVKLAKSHPMSTPHETVRRK